MVNNTLPIVVGGCHRSGTSLVRRLLNTHSRIHCPPEVKFFRDFHGDYPNDPLWSFRYVATARVLASEDELLELFGRTFVTLHERAAARRGKPRWADKNPENVLYLADWQRLLGDAWLFIHVVRNPLDTVASIKEAKFPRIIPADLAGRIALYRRYSRAGLDFATANPDRHYRLHYERLVRSPEATLRDLMAWLGEGFEPAQLAFNEAPQQRGLEDPKIAETSAVHTKSVDRWPTVLSAEEARLIEDETRDLWALLNADADFDVSVGNG